MPAKEQNTQRPKSRCRKAFRLISLIRDYFTQAGMTPLKIEIHKQNVLTQTRYVFEEIVISNTQEFPKSFDSL